jgi:hypothetical protein
LANKFLKLPNDLTDKKSKGGNNLWSKREVNTKKDREKALSNADQFGKTKFGKNCQKNPRRGEKSWRLTTFL